MSSRQGLVRVRGQVQGVGFRPFVYRLANELSLHGWVRNDAEGVEISIRGEDGAVSDFLSRLKSDGPVLSRVEGVEFEEAFFDESLQDFTVETSRGGRINTAIAPDVSVCGDCLAELLDSSNRRYRHPFINCTHCGPRYTIVGKLPYDRKHTSMAKFAQCPACEAEYRDPFDRRFHAQPNACKACGPQLVLVDAKGVSENDPVESAVKHILSGKILAIKGIGGFHLVCDARKRDVVARLRASKCRMEKPLAVMVPSRASLAPFAVSNRHETALLESQERPIVLIEKTKECDAELPGVAPGTACIGVMLPYTPLQYLLFHEAAGRPEGLSWLEEEQPLVLVMTSANPKGEPLVVDNVEAFERLDGIADFFLLHDRDILQRCDDSVMRWNGTAPQFVRRARGFTPRALKLPIPGPSVLAFGSGYKNTVCATRGDEAFLSQHIGDLDNAASCLALEEAAAHLMEVLQIEPEIVAHDLHPDFFSSRHAAEFAERKGIAAVAVQHHHAHIAAVMAEHGVNEPVLGLALDGIGLGEDGGIWGGELLQVGAEGSFSRLGHLAHLALPGGDSAAREPWRMAASALHALGRDDEIVRRYGKLRGNMLIEMFERNLNVPVTSSAGRWFDAAAGILGVIEKTSFEGQAAMLLEGLAIKHGPVAPLESGFVLEEGILNFLPLLEILVDMKDAPYGAALFHATLSEGLRQWLRGRELSTVVLSGGCFMNSVLSSSLKTKLEDEGHAVLEAGFAPPNDGGISLGQAFVAMQRSAAACA